MVNVDINEDYVKITYTGKISIENIKKAIEELHENPKRRSKMNSLWDLRNTDLKDVKSRDLKELAYFISNKKEKISSKIAIVVGKDVDFGVARMWEVYAEIVPRERKVFRNMDEAIIWLVNETKGD